MDERDEIRQRVDIVSLISSEMPLKKVGKNFQGLCPFHPDKNPSMTVSPSTGRYKCWSCGATGDIFNWVMNRQNVDFVEALRILAKEAGVTLKSREGGEKSKSYAEPMAAALAFFQEQLIKSATAREYCERRGLDSETLTKWGIGYAPEMGEALANHLKKLGFSLQDCKDLFLVDTDPSGGFFDKFRGRLMFPIKDERGATVGFGGRVLGTGMPKYINSGDTPLYRKSRVLYGFSEARDSIGKLKRAVLVEGYLDVIACHAAGVTQAVASLGTSATEEQAKLLKRWAEEVTILYDSDEAGQKAADRAIAVMQAEGLRVRVSLLPKGDDPDSLLRQKGPAAVSDAVAKGLPPIDFKIRRLEEKLDPSDERFWQEALEILADAPNELELDRQLVRLAPKYPNLTDAIQAQKALKRTVGNIRRARAFDPEASRQAARSITRARTTVKDLESAEVVVFRAFLSSKFRKEGWMFSRHGELFVTTLGKELSTAIALTFPTAAPSGEVSQWLSNIEPERLRSILADIEEDLRGDMLKEDYITESIVKLREKATLQKTTATRPLLDSDEERQKYLEQLKKLKPIPPQEAESTHEDW